MDSSIPQYVRPRTRLDNLRVAAASPQAPSEHQPPPQGRNPPSVPPAPALCGVRGFVGSWVRWHCCSAWPSEPKLLSIVRAPVLSEREQFAPDPPCHLLGCRLASFGRSGLSPLRSTVAVAVALGCCTLDRASIPHRFGWPPMRISFKTVIVEVITILAYYRQQGSS